MFTGIVEEMGAVADVRRLADRYEMSFSCKRVLEGTQIGDSIAVNGTCLTVTRFSDAQFSVDVAPETRSRTNLGELQNGDPVNLERAVTPSTRLGGHFVQGHIDNVGRLIERRPDGEAIWLTIQAPADVMRYVVPKGFICLDGVSLTVVDVHADRFSIMLVPHTQTAVGLPAKQVGAKVNIEVDILGKYVEKFIAGAAEAKTGAMTPEWLAENGYGS